MIDFITVVFRQELFYLEIQASSIEQHVDTDKIGTIFVVVNDAESVCSLVDTDWYGVNKHKVRVVWAESFGRTDFLDGWASQQYYKLATANIADSKWSACLDAKTWFVRTLDFDLLFDKQNRARLAPMPTIPVFRPAEQAVNEFFNIDSKQVIGPGGVPFLFNTQEMHLLTKFLCAKDTNLHQYFTKAVQAPSFVTEFMFYSGWIAYRHGDHSKLYSNKQYYKVTNVADFEVKDVESKFNQMKLEENLTASIHRRVYLKLTRQELETWVNFLVSKNLTKNYSNEYVMKQLLNTANVE